MYLKHLLLCTGWKEAQRQTHICLPYKNLQLFFVISCLKVKSTEDIGVNVFPPLLFKVLGDRGTNHGAFPPHIGDHGRRGDVPASQRPQPRLQRPLLAVELRRRRAAGGRVGGPPVERPGAARQVPRTPVCARALVLLHATHQEEPLVKVGVCTTPSLLPPPRAVTYSDSQKSPSSSSSSSSSTSSLQ